MAGALGVCALAGACVVSLLVAGVFPALEPALRSEVGICIPILVAAQLLNVQAGVAFNYFVGAQRSTSPAHLLTWWRVATLGAIVAGGVLGSGVIGLSLLLLLGNLGGAAAMMRRLRHDHRPQSSASPSTELGPEQRVEQGTGKPESPSLLRAGREVIRSTGAMAFWSIAMLCITGLDLIVVGRVDFSAVGAYAIAASLTAAITGLGNALQLPMMPRLAATRTRAAMMSRLGWMTGINAVAVIGFAAAVILVVGTPLIGVLAPHTLRSSAAELTVILTAAVALRLMGGPLALALIASGASNRVFVPQLLESIVNVVASITLGVLFGAVGVAFGTLIGAVCGLLGLLLGSIPRWFGRTWLRPIAAALLWDPLRCAGPLVAVVVAYLCGAGWALTTPLLVAALAWLTRSSTALLRRPPADTPEPPGMPATFVVRPHNPRIASERML